MKPIGKYLILFCLCVGAASLLAACGAATPTPAQPTLAPTADLNALRTEVAATVLAKVPQLCAQTPSPTVPPTATLKPSPTVAPTEGTPQATQTPLVATGGTPAPTQSLLDQAKFVSQTVPDGSVFQPGQEFIMTWKVQNSGQSTWTNKYILRFFAGNQFGAPAELPLVQDVKPGETVELTMTMHAPNTPGEYVSNWVMSNQDRSNFKEPLFLKIVVPAPTKAPTSTPKPTITLTPSITPTK